MARIPEAEIERLKEGVPVGRLVKASGVELKEGGKVQRAQARQTARARGT